MPSFNIKWDDFGGGYYIGQNESLQPRNTFTGHNVNVASHDGAVVPANQVWQPNLVLYPGTTGITVANNSIHVDESSTGDHINIVDTYMSNEYSFTLLHKNTLAGDYAKIISVSFSPTLIDGRSLAFQNATVKASQWVAIAGPPSKLAPSFASARFLAGGFLYSCNATSISSLGSVGVSAPILIRYGMRLVAASGNTIYFSEANNDLSWPSTNYITVGSSSSALAEALIPRYDDLVFVVSDGVYSIYGTLGFNAAVKKISETFLTGSLYTSQENVTLPITGMDNSVFFIDETLVPYAANINFLYGNQTKTLAYHRIGRSIYGYGTQYQTKPSLVATNSNCLVAMWSQLGTGQAGFEALIRKKNKTFVKLKQAPLTFTGGEISTANYAISYSAQNDREAQPLGFYDNIFVSQYATYRNPSTWAITRVSISVGIWQPEQINAAFLPGPPSGAGSSSTTNTATPGLLELSPIETEVPSKVKRVYIEAELNLDFYEYDDFRGTAYVKAYVQNRAVDDVSFTNGVEYESSQMLTSVDLTTVNGLTSQYTPYAWNPTQPYSSTNDKKRASVTRILRFDPTDSGYGYKHYIMLEFAGFRIKRVWVEGETR